MAKISAAHGPVFVIINQAHTLTFWFLQLLVDKRWNQN